MKVVTVAPPPTGQRLVPANRVPEGEGTFDFAAILAGLCAALPAEQDGAQAGDWGGTGGEVAGGAESAEPPDLAKADQTAQAGSNGGGLITTGLPLIPAIPAEVAPDQLVPAEASAGPGESPPGAAPGGSSAPDPVTTGAEKVQGGGTAALPEMARASAEAFAVGPGEESTGELKAQAALQQGTAPEEAVSGSPAKGAAHDQRAGPRLLTGSGDSSGGKGASDTALPEAAAIDPAARGEKSGGQEVESSPEASPPSRKQAGPALRRSGTGEIPVPASAPQATLSVRLPDSGAAYGDPATAATQPAPETVALPETAATPGEPARPEIPGFKDNLLQEIQGRLLYFRERGGVPAEMRLQLRPPELGEVTIRVFSREGKLSAAIIAELPVVREILEGSISELRQRFQQCNLPLEQLDLFTAGREGEGSRHCSAGDYPGAAWRPGAGRAASNRLPEQGPERLPEIAWGGGHVIDYRA